MIINLIAARPGMAVGAASPAADEQADFASELDSLLADAVVEDAPVTLADKAWEASVTPDEETTKAAAAWLMPASLADAVMASLPSASVVAPQTDAPGLLHEDAGALPLRLESAGARTEPHQAAVDMLRMIASPQAGHQTDKPAESQAIWIKSAATSVQHQEGENPGAALPAEQRSQPLPLAAAFSPASLSAPAVAPSAVNTAPTMAYGALEPQVGSPAWQQALGQQLSAFTRNGVHHAELRLHPEHLGPLHIKLRLDQDQVQLHFVTDQQPVRAALEAAMPHLRTSLADAGIQLDQGSVGRDASAWGPAADSDPRHSSHHRQQADGPALIEAEEESVPQRLSSPLGINIFA